VDDDTVIWKSVEREVGGEALPDAEQKDVRVAGAAAPAAAPAKAAATEPTKP
jgi:hypothetical protein